MALTFTVERAPSGIHVLRYDASMHKHSGCWRRMHNSLLCGLTGEGKDVNMEYGTAAHKALQLWYSGHPEQKCLDTAIKHMTQPDIHIMENEWRNVPHLVNCLMQYFNWWKANGEMLKPLSVNGKLLLEQRFAYPYLKTERCQVLLCGTMDMVAHHSAFDCTVIEDHKSTSATYEDQYLAAYRLSPQLMIYFIVFRELFPELARGAGCQINGLFLRKTNKNVFKRSDVFRFSDEMLRPFQSQLTTRLTELCVKFESVLDGADMDEVFPPNYLECENHFGCEFADSCAQPDRAIRVELLEGCFVQRRYDPATHQT